MKKKMNELAQGGWGNKVDWFEFEVFGICNNGVIGGFNAFRL
jgi:hypothetical protein